MYRLKRLAFQILFVGSIALPLTSFSLKGHVAPNFKVIAYLFNKKVPISQLPYQYLTHINYSFALPAPDSTGNILPVPVPDRLAALSKTAHAHGVKVFISIGGWEIGDGGGNDSRFEVLANNPDTRTTFTESAMRIVRKFNLDGVDVDWEYPDPIEPSASNYVLLMKQLSDSLHAAGKKLSAAIVAFKDIHGYGIKKEVFPYVDWMNIMAYDYKNEENMPHSPYWLAVRSLDYWINDRGLPKNKAVLGLNFGFYRFLISKGANPYADSYITDASKWRFKKSGHPHSLDTIYYNGIVTVKEKTKLAKDRCAGIMMWAVAGDTAGTYSLLKAIHEVNKGSNNNHEIETAKVLINQVGYDNVSLKRAVVSAHKKLNISTYQLIQVKNDSVVYEGKVSYKGRIDHWKDWQFWILDFSDFTQPGAYFLKINTPTGYALSRPFKIKKDILERYTLSDVIYYFKGQRCSGLFEKADSHLQIPGGHGTVDVRGGWYDATGDYGIHFTQLSNTSYFNTQQVPMTAWSLLKAYRELQSRDNLNFSQYERRLIDEGMFGADFLVRMHIPGSSFYTSISAPGTKKLAEDRHLAVVIPDSVLKKLNRVGHPADDFRKGLNIKFKPQIATFRAGGGIAIAALALAATFDVSGDFSQKDYLSAAEAAFEFLQKNNKQLVNDGKENIVDDYCALLAATELYRASHKQVYKKAASVRADRLMNRLTDWKTYHNYWRANDKDRPFFNPADAGLPVVSLLEYYQIADEAAKAKVLNVVKKSMQFYLKITSEVTNPFGYARQLVQDTTGYRHSAFFFPHNTETGFWWQGENARIASLATAARMSASYFKQEDPVFYHKLEGYAQNQLNWILGLNPYDACMQDGKGYNNPQYNFLGTFQYTVAPGGIVNGITGGMKDPQDIAFDIPYSITGEDNDWRWVEQWLPHAAWYMLAVSVGH